mgnify:CR=1 FL=1
MCFSQDDSKRNCLTNILDTILCLQEKKDSCCEEGGCDKPYLGPTPNLVCYNTRPINFYNCMSGTLWTFPYTLGKQVIHQVSLELKIWKIIVVLVESLHLIL